MSQENVEVVRKTFEYWKRGNLDAVAEAFDDDVVFRTAEGWPARAIHVKAAVRSFLEEYAQTVGHDTVIEDIIDAGGVVVVRLRAHLSGDRSGIEGDQRYSNVTTLREGKVVLTEYFWDHQEALEAAGLSE